MAAATLSTRPGSRTTRKLVAARQYGCAASGARSSPKAAAENAYLRNHDWDAYGAWFLGLTDGADEETKARYAFVFGDFRRIHQSGVIACHYRAAEWRTRRSSSPAHELLQELDAATA